MLFVFDVIKIVIYYLMWIYIKIFNFKNCNGYE